MDFIKRQDMDGVICRGLFHRHWRHYTGLLLATPTRSLGYIRILGNTIYVDVTSQDLIRLWPHRTYSENRTNEFTEPIIKEELEKRGFFLSFKNGIGKWTKRYGQTYLFRDLTKFDTFVLPEEFDELDVALCGGPFKLYAKTGKTKSNLCLPEEEKIGLGEEFDIQEDTPVLYWKKRN